MKPSTILRKTQELIARLGDGQTPAKVAGSLGQMTNLEREFLTTTLPRLIAAGWQDARCVFSPSTGRAGSMQLAAVLGLSPDVLAVHEPVPMLLEMGARAFSDGCEDRCWRDVVHAVRDELIAFANHKDKVYVETNNRMTFFAPAIADAYPASRFIYLHRHPYEVIRSGLSRGWYSGSHVDFSLIRPRPDDPYSERWAAMHAAEKIAWFWMSVNAGVIGLFERVGSHRTFALPAKVLFEARDEAISQLFAFVGVNMPPIEKVRANLSRRLNARRGRDSGNRDLWSDKHVSMVKPIVAEMAEKLGYDL
jgi:hypothetical protein